MKNLKRALSLTMASTMLVSMMATGASAASFPDADEINNLDAVNTLVALNIINGKDDGTFDPTAVVTRGEMAKMICVALNGGKDPNLTGGGLYSDTVGHWASGYIDYCTNLGIVAGFNGLFRPNDTVTGVEAAKMLLIAIGHNAEDEGYVNSASWDLNISIDANTKGLYENLMIVPSAGLSRDNAAQMILNGINANMVWYDYKLTTTDGDLQSVAIAYNYENKTILTEKYKALDEEGILENSSYNADKGLYTYTVDGNSYTATADFSALFGMNVNVFYKDSTSATKEAYGMYAYGSEVLFSGLAADIGEFDTTEIELDGTTYDFNTGAAVYNFNVHDKEDTADLTEIDGKYNYEITAIDNNEDGKIDVIVVLPYDVVEVTYVGTTDITLECKYGNDITGVVTVGSDVYPEGIEAGDVLKLIDADNTVDGAYVLEAMDLVEGTVSSRSGTAGSYKFRINGSWYTSETELTMGSEYTAYAVGTHIFVAEEIGEGVSVDSVVYLSAAVKNSGLDSDTYTARIYFLDGTSEVVTLANVYDEGGETEIEITNDSGTDFEGQGLYTYKISSGEYTLTAMGTGNDAGFDHIGTGTEVEDGQLDNGFYVADSAIVVAIDEDSDIYFLTGSDVNAWDGAFGTEYLALANDVNGLETAEVLYIVGTEIPGLTGTETYGYVTSEVSYELDANGDGVYTFTVWTAEGAETVYTDDADLAEIAVLGTTISFELAEDGEVSEIVAVGDAMAVTAFSSTVLRADVVVADDALSGSATDYTLNDDTTYIYVNTSSNSGVAGGSLRTATQYNSGKYYSNVVIVENEDGEAVVVFIDVNNKFEA